MKTAEFARLLGKDERFRLVKNIVQMDQPSFVVKALYEQLQSIAERNEDEEVKRWIVDLRELEDQMMGKLL